MRRLLLTLVRCVSILAITSCAVMADSDLKKSGQIYVSNRPEDFAARIYLGTDGNMPIDGKYLFSIQPTAVKSEDTIVPSSIPEAFQEMRRTIPHWYLAALSRSEGENECSVFVNNVDYTTSLESWFWVNWHLGSESSRLRQRFVELGINSQLLILNAISMGFCEFVKKGGNEEAAMSVVTTYAGKN